MSRNAGRSWGGGNRQWWAREASTGNAREDAARHLRLVAGRFVNGRANAREVDEAINVWREASAPGKETPRG